MKIITFLWPEANVFVEWLLFDMVGDESGRVILQRD